SACPVLEFAYILRDECAAAALLAGNVPGPVFRDSFLRHLAGVCRVVSCGADNEGGIEHA
ncbi:MAG TPA: hypothetical protein PLJ50_12790, partial [Candidatus Latescibacteria bacterium]|nr:hypothetical protein [Candidatus Latescibacterota bacterium]